MTRPAAAPPHRGLRALMLCAMGAIVLFAPTGAHAASPDDDAVAAALASWDVLQKNVKVSRLSRKVVDGITVSSGKARVFGSSVELEARAKGTDVHQLKLTFSPRRQLKTDQLVALAGSDLLSELPAGVGAGFGVERVEVDFANRRPVTLRLVLDAGSWAPFGRDGLKISDLEAMFTLYDPTGARELEARLTGVTRVPPKLAKYLGIGATDVAISGIVNTLQKSLMLVVDLTSEEIPLGDQRVVVLQGAQLRLGFVAGAPTLALGGTLGVRPDRGGPLTLKGEVALKLTGEIFAQGWNDGVWSNPLGASERLHIRSPGVGFGVDFSAVPWPMPILAIQGGLAVGADPGHPDFGGTVLVGVHGGDPTQNMIDASLDALSVYDLANPFVSGGVPAHLRETLRGIRVTDGRLTVVPPGPGVTLFGVYYPPGFQVAGKLDVDSFHGELNVDVSPVGVEAYAAITPIRFPGFSISGAGGAPGPYFYLVATQGVKALAINGTLDVLGIERTADVYFSDQGFSATLSGDLFGVARAEVEVAGRSPFKDGGGLFVAAKMDSSFDKALMDAVVARIDEHVAQARTGFQAARASLERDRVRLVALDKRLNAAREKARRDLKQQCGGFQQSDRARQNKAAEKARMDAAVAGTEATIADLKAKIAGAKATAVWKGKSLTPIGCGRGQVWDPIHGGGCYACPGGTARDATVHIEKLGSCSRSTAAWNVELAKQTTLLAAQKTDRDVVRRALTALERGVNRAAEASCHTLADATAIDRLPGVRDVLGEHAGVNLLINGAQAVVDGSEFVTLRTANTAKWLAARGGEVAGIFQLERAGFEGCISAVTGGRVAMHIKGRFADQPVDGAFEVTLTSPEAGMRALADALFKTGKPPATRGNGTCKRPATVRPNPANVRVPDRVTALRKKQGKGAKGSPTVAKPPAWAPKPDRSGRATAGGPSATKPKDTKPTPRVDATEMCRRAVQGQVARDASGRKAWPAGDLEALCGGTADGAQPGACFTDAVSERFARAAGAGWGTPQAIALCGGTSDARATLSCFVTQVRSGGSEQALAACKAH